MGSVYNRYFLNISKTRILLAGLVWHPLMEAAKGWKTENVQ